MFVASSSSRAAVSTAFAAASRHQCLQQRRPIVRLSSSARSFHSTVLWSTPNKKSPEETETASSAHRKTYHIQGSSTTPVTSTTPASPNNNNNNNNNKQKNRRPRRRMCGPGVTMTTNTNHQLQTDIPKSMGGTNEAPQPVETLLAALLGCTQATSIFVGRQLGITIEQLDFVDITAVRDERGALTLPIDQTPEVPSRLQEITGTVRVYTPELIPKDQFLILQEQTELRCPVANMMIASGCQMNVEWIQEVTTT